MRGGRVWRRLACQPLVLVVALSVLGGACADAGDGAAPSSRVDGPRAERCAACHAEVVALYRGSHAMASSLGPVGELPAGSVTHPATGMRYDVRPDAGGGGLLVGTRADGGRREQALVGRIGAGVLDTSLVAAERVGGVVGGRLAFAPVELLSGHGWELSPFEVFGGGAGLDQPVTAECLACHTDTDVASLPGAATALDAGGRRRAHGPVFPRQHLGADAFAQLQPLGCETCHGDADPHVAAMEARGPDAPPPADAVALGLQGWRDLAVTTQREVCARCHLEGEARVTLGDASRAGLDPRAPLLGRVPVLVSGAPDDDFRFVGQVERLALSACFQRSPAMTCVSCHLPHAGVAAQGSGSFERACLGCHGGGAGCARPPGLTVESVSGAPARGAEGCVDCHVRRSQPYDLGHIATADHFVRRTIPPPSTSAPRPFHDRRGPLAVFRDGVLDELLARPGGARWEQGVLALGLLKQGRHDEAADRLADFPAPGAPDALTPTAPPGLLPLETSAVFHGLRGQLLEAVGEQQAALAAYGDALTIDPGHPEARLNRAALRAALGDVRGAVADTELLLAAHPLADKAWNVNAQAAGRAGDLAAALAALGRSAELWPSSAAAHHEAGRLLLRAGELARARVALQQAAALEPSRPGLADDLAAAGR